MPTGRLTKKIHSQPAHSVSTPPKRTPAAAPDAADGAPDAERLVALRALREGRRDDRERRRGDDRGADALDGARDDQHGVALGQAAEQRREREDGDADQEHATAAEEVGGAPAEQQEAAEGDGVGRQHPLQVLRREVEVGLDRRQRDVDDRDVEDGHEEGGADNGESLPATRVELGRGAHGLLLAVASRLLVKPRTVDDRCRAAVVAYAATDARGDAPARPGRARGPQPVRRPRGADGRALLQANRTLLLGVRAGELELWATRRPDGGVAVEQVLGGERRPLAMRRASFTRGIRGLVRLVVRRPSGAVVTTTYVDACPNSPLAQPFDLASAPPLRRYPFDCGHVLSTSVVWGLERGWAVPLDLQLPQLEPGAYVLEASLAPDRLLHRNRAGDRVRVPVRVTRPAGARVGAAAPPADQRNARSDPSAAPHACTRRAPRLPDLRAAGARGLPGRAHRRRARRAALRLQRVERRHGARRRRRAAAGTGCAAGRCRRTRW